MIGWWLFGISVAIALVGFLYDPIPTAIALVVVWIPLLITFWAQGKLTRKR